MCMLFTVTQGTMVHFMTVCLSQWLGCNHDKAVFVFVSDANAHYSEWIESVSPTNRHGRDVLDFAICQVVSSRWSVPHILLVIDSML